MQKSLDSVTGRSEAQQIWLVQPPCLDGQGLSQYLLYCSPPAPGVPLFAHGGEHLADVGSQKIIHFVSLKPRVGSEQSPEWNGQTPHTQTWHPGHPAVSTLQKQSKAVPIYTFEWLGSSCHLELQTCGLSKPGCLAAGVTANLPGELRLGSLGSWSHC